MTDPARTIWLPYLKAGSGTDTFTHDLAAGLAALGHRVILQAFPGRLEVAPWLLSMVRPPDGADAAITNSWNGFAFRRKGLALIVVEHLFVLDPRLAPYKSRAQRLAHSLLVRRFVEASYRAADRVVAVSERVAMAMQELYPDLSAQIIRNGIDTGFFTPGEAPPPSAKRHRLLFVGNPTHRKGADLFVPLLEALGDGWELAVTTGLRDLGLIGSHPRLVPLGRLDRAGVRAACRTADMLVLPSRAEGLPLVALEAMACGTPVAGFDSASLAEIVTDGVDGVIAAQDDVAALALSIRAFVADAERLDRARLAAREAAARRDRTAMAGAYARLLDIG